LPSDYKFIELNLKLNLNLTVTVTSRVKQSYTNCGMNGIYRPFLNVTVCHTYNSITINFVAPHRTSPSVIGVLQKKHWTTPVEHKLGN